MKKIKFIIVCVFAFTFSHAQNTWVQKANFGGTGRYGAFGFSIGTKGYMGCGWDGSTFRNDCWEYDQGTNTWTQKANFGGNPRIGGQGLAIGTKGYVGCGLDGVGPYNDFWRYDPSTNAWAAMASFPGVARYALTALSIGAKGYMGLGTETSSGPYHNDFYEYDPATNTWVVRSSFPGAVRTGCEGFDIGGKGYLGMGSNFTLGVTYGDWYEFDPSINSWIPKNNFPGNARTGFASFAIGSLGFIGTGVTYPSGTLYNDFWEYHPLTDSWIQRASFSGTSRSSTASFSIGSKGYIGTGSDGTNRNDFWEYTPIVVITATVSSTNNSCFGSGNGTATVTPSGGTSPYTYSWAPIGGTNATASNLPSGTYTCTITDANSNTITQTVSITQPSVLNVSVTNTSASCNPTGSATAIPSGGTGPYTYSWSPAGGTNATAINLSAGTYSVSVTDANGCNSTQTTTIVSGSTLTATISSVNSSCVSATNGSSTVVPSGGTGPYTFSWSPSGGTNATANGLSAGTYTCTITDANGCTTSQFATILSGTPPTASITSTNNSCFAASNGSATAVASGGTAPYTYSWSPSGGTNSTAINLSAGNYTCSIIDANGCTCQQTVSIAQPTQMSASAVATTITCFGGTSMATVAVAGGTPNYSYAWSPSGGNSQTAIGLGANTYSVTITDANGCTTQQTLSITQPSQITTSAISTNLNCFGNSNAQATVVASGGNPGYTYLWLPSGGNAQTANGLSAGIYTVTVTDASGCHVNNSVTITSPSQIVVDVVQNNSATCFGNCNGAATVNGSGGISPYTYLWSPNANTTQSCVNLCAGNYTVNITDANGCQSATTVVITQPTQLTASATFTDETLAAANDGAATVTASGGTGTDTYAWSPSGGTSATATGLDAGTYTCTITDANGCTTTVAVTIGTTNGVGIASLSNENLAVSIFPNPSNGIFYLQTEMTNVHFEVYDLLGQVVFSQLIAATQTEINLENKSNGVYFVRVISNENGNLIYQKKIIKE